MLAGINQSSQQTDMYIDMFEAADRNFTYKKTYEIFKAIFKKHNL